MNNYGAGENKLNGRRSLRMRRGLFFFLGTMLTLFMGIVVLLALPPNSPVFGGCRGRPCPFARDRHFIQLSTVCNADDWRVLEDLHHLGLQQQLGVRELLG